MISRTPNTFVVGAGRLATALAGGLRHAGVPVLGLWGRRPDRAREAGAKSGVAAFSSAPPDLLLEANVVLLAVSDESIGSVAKMLVGTGLISRKHVLVHSSGALSAREAFADVVDSVGGIATMHPLRSIADGASAIREWQGCVFGVEGDGAGAKAATDLVGALGGQVLELKGDAMAAYHAAAATASNYLVALLDGALSILASSGFGDSDEARDKAKAALVALMRGTLDNLEAKSPADALTGPIRRGDSATIARHLEVLEAAPAEVAEAYRVMGRLTVELAKRAVAGETSESTDTLAAIDEISDLLSGTSGAPSFQIVR